MQLPTNSNMGRPVTACFILLYIVGAENIVWKSSKTKWWMDRENETGDWCWAQSYCRREDDLAKSQRGVTKATGIISAEEQKTGCHYETSSRTECLNTITI